MNTPEASFVLRKAWAWGKACQDCGLNLPCALEQARDGAILCRECRLKRQGHRRLEHHHLFGRGEQSTLAVPANLHACITEIEAVTGKLPVLLTESALLLFGPMFVAALLFMVLCICQANRQQDLNG